MHDVLVIGGGVAGLAAAERLARGGVDVVCLDSGAAPGGVTSSHLVDGFLFERGPFNVHCRAPEFAALLQELATELQVTPLDASRGARRYVVHGGALRRVPGGPGAALRSPLLGVRGAARALRGLVASVRPAAGSEPTVDEVVRRRFGARVADNLVSALTVGVFGVESDSFEASTALPFLGALDAAGASPLLGLLRRRRATRRAAGGADDPRGAGAAAARPRGMLSFEGGLAALPRALARRLGPRHRANAPVARLARTTGADGATRGWCASIEGGGVVEAREVVLAVGARAAAALTRGLGREGAALAAELDAVEHTSLTVLNLGFRSDAFSAPLDGYGFLVARGDRREPVLGVLYASSVFPRQAPPGHVALRVFFGGTRHPALATADEDTLLDAACDVLRRHAGLAEGPRGTPVTRDLVRWPGAVPIYRPGHAARVARVRALEARLDGLALAGTYLDGVSVNDCVARGVRVALGILAARAQ